MHLTGFSKSKRKRAEGATKQATEKNNALVALIEALPVASTTTRAAHTTSDTPALVSKHRLQLLKNASSSWRIEHA
jgi:hypothetical protein